MRTFFAILSGVILLAATGYICYEFRVTPDQIHATDFDEYRTTTLGMIREQSTGFFNIAVLVLGALWGTLVVSKDNRLRRCDVQEIIMFIVTNLILCGFFYFNLKYTDLLARLYWDMGPILSQKKKFADVINSKYVLIHFQSVLFCFYGGLLSGALTVFSACMLRRVT